MGLYGAVTDDVESGIAYTGVPYTQDVVLFYSEVDKQMHLDVYDRNPNTPNYDEGDMQSTIDYAPKHFLIDVLPGSDAITVAQNEFSPTLNIPAGDGTLFRFFNAGQHLHVPTILSGDFVIHAEDGNQYPASRQQYTVDLPPLKTKDAIIRLGSAEFVLTDSAMALSNPAVSNSTSVPAPAPVGGVRARALANGEIANGDGNGMVLNIAVTSPAGSSSAVTASADAPVARRDRMTVLEGGAIDNILANALSNDSNASLDSVNILSYPHEGQLVLANGSYRYEHDGGEKDRDVFVYEISNAAGELSHTNVVIDVMPVNDPPVAKDDTVQTQVGKTIEIRALRNDTDVDNRITITAVDGSTLGEMTANDQVIVFQATTEGTEDVSYSIADAAGAAASAVIHLTVGPASADSTVYSASANTSAAPAAAASTARQGNAPTAVDDAYNVAAGQVLDTTSGGGILGVLANDQGDAKVNTKLIRYPLHGAIRMFDNGSFIYTHDGSADAGDDFVYEIYNDFGVAKGKVTINVNQP
jgi:hypothetical protein